MSSEIYKLLIYQNLLEDEVIKLFIQFMDKDSEKERIQYSFKIQRALINESSLRIIGWKEYIIRLLMEDENIFSLTCEQGKDINEMLMALVIEDIKVIRGIIHFDWHCITERSDRITVFHCNEIFDEYHHIYQFMMDTDIDERQIAYEMIKYFNKNGVGIFAQHNVFRWQDKLQAIQNFDGITFHDLIGYDEQINRLKENTLSFITMGKGNNVLLYGERGTGKSSSVKALIEAYKNKGLRMIELKKSQLQSISMVIEEIRKRNFKFIIFIDDLSFEEFEVEYKAFKGILEGSLEKKPENVLIYVTSNRRHLIRESFRDREEDVHSNETMQEKLSLFDRFGISILYTQPKDELFNKMVLELAKKNGVLLPEDKLLQLANEYRVSKASKSGRVAKQLVDSLVHKYHKNK
ncbi:MAG: ATP-binding protein [Eubacteriales bacterium]